MLPSSHGTLVDRFRIVPVRHDGREPGFGTANDFTFAVL
jgi:hypothetical protein